MLEAGDIAPEFCLPNQDSADTCLSMFRGKYVVLYFYPKDDTPGCTREAVDFTSRLDEFKSLNTMIVGVSPDPVDRHRKFVDRHGLKIILLSDTDHKVLKLYNVWRVKKRFGREYYGVLRSTFLIDPDGRIIRIWWNVRVKGHVEDVLNTLRKYVKGV